MKNFRIVVITLLLAFAVPFMVHYRGWAVSALHRSELGAQGMEGVSLQIVSPKPNEELAQAFVTVRYQPSSGISVSANPVYELNLDGRDPVRTTEAHYTFNGLTSGTHQIIIQAVDAGGEAILRTTSSVKFVIDASRMESVGGAQVANLPEPPLPRPPQSDLPNVNSSLPLLSVIGFGILVGGVISALRTRPAHK